MDEVGDVFELHEAAAAGLREECEQLIVAGKDVNTADQLGWTPLMHAVRNRHCLVARFLLSHKADVCIQNHHGVTAFTLAVLGCDEDLLTTLYHGLAPCDLQRDESNKALQVASVRGVYPAARWLLTNTSVDVNLVSSTTGVAPLHLAVIGHHDQLAELLIRFGADTINANALGQDVFELAKACGNKGLFQLLHKDMSPAQDICFDFRKDIENPNFDCIDSQFTSNNICLDLQEDIILKNSPCRPVFKTSRDDNEFDCKREQEIKSLMSPSRRSVFLPSPQLNRSWATNESHPNHNLHGLISPRVHPRKSPVMSPNRGKKRKLLNSSGCSSWLKRLTKRRSRSMNDDLQNLDASEDSFKLDFFKPNGIDFSQLLFNLGLEDFFPTFREQELDIWTFLTLTKEDLDAMGLTDAESQALILKRINMLKKTQL